MERRKGVTVLGILSLAFLIIGVAIYFVNLFAFAQLGFNDFLATNVDLFNTVIGFDFANKLIQIIYILAPVAIFVILTIIWLIVDNIRKRHMVWLFVLMLLFGCYSVILYFDYFDYYLHIFTNGTDIAALFADWTTILLVGGAASSAIATILLIVLFFVDLATGKVEKQASPTFIQEPSEENQEPVYEPVRDENEPAVAPAPVEEAPVEQQQEVHEDVVEEPIAPEEEVEQAQEEAPVEEKPAKKPAAKKSTKKAPAKKKAAPKKEEAKQIEEAPVEEVKEAKPAKKASAKKPAKKAEEKPAEEKKEEKPADTRKTQTITLVNEDGVAYAKAYHVSRRAELNKWQVKATGSSKALKLFNTQKEAIAYAEELAQNQNSSIRVHSKEGKIRKHK